MYPAVSGDFGGVSWPHLENALGGHFRIGPLHFYLVLHCSLFVLEVIWSISELFWMRQNYHGIKLFCLYMYSLTCRRCRLFDFLSLFVIQTVAADTQIQKGIAGSQWHFAYIHFKGCNYWCILNKFYKLSNGMRDH